ncbi:MAG: ATP-grasp domain-containing protein [Candidatus Sericytochromatia bacterium]|nr:ATP-grasp domain-containing protein [Candidatus Sericytochromatia bacterium]
MKTLLITGIAGDIAQGIATLVKEIYPDWRILGMDIHLRHGGGSFVDQFYLAPRADHPDYLSFLFNLVKSERVDICIPMSEAELTLLAQFDPQQRPDLIWILANSKAIKIGSDKLETAQFLTEIGVPGPWSLDVNELSEHTPFPCIFKPRRSAGSKAIFICEGPDEVKFLRQRYVDGLLQELLLPFDQEVTCALFRSQKTGEIAVLQLLRALTGGFTGWAEVIDHAEILAQAHKIAEALDLNGSINLQLRLTEMGPRIFEINPRFSSTVLIRHRMGFQDVVWSIQDALGEKYHVFQPPTGLRGVRSHDARILKTNGQGAE